jgi:hypothetical protein
MKRMQWWFDSMEGALLLPQDDAAILGTPPGMFPSPRRESSVHSRAALSGCKPGVDDDTGARI